MKLNVSERFNLLNLLPEKADYVTMNLVTDVRKRILLTEEEIKKFEFRTEGESLKWDAKTGAEEVEIEIGEIVTEEVKKKLNEMNEKRELEERFVPLYRKFIVEQKAEKKE